jgi:RNA polymerase sigma-70 factor (ECF subfamily)
LDKDFLGRLRSGEEAAFRELVESYQEKILGTCFRFLHNREDAEDTAQDVFVEVHRNLSAFREEVGLATWIYRIAVTRSLDVIRKKKRKKRFDAVRRSLGLAVGAESVPAPEDDEPAQALEIRERSRILSEAVAALPENQRVAITLSRYEGLGNKAIAGILDTTVPAVDALIHRAHKNLKKKLTRYYGKAFANEDQNEPQVRGRNDV